MVHFSLQRNLPCTVEFDLRGLEGAGSLQLSGSGQMGLLKVFQSLWFSFEAATAHWMGRHLLPAVRGTYFFLPLCILMKHTYRNKRIHGVCIHSYHLGGCRCEAFTVAARSTSLHADIIVDLNGKCRYMRLETIVHASVCDCNSTRIAELATARFDSDKYSGVKSQVLQGMVVKGHDRLS